MATDQSYRFLFLQYLVLAGLIWFFLPFHVDGAFSCLEVGKEKIVLEKDFLEKEKDSRSEQGGILFCIWAIFAKCADNREGNQLSKYRILHAETTLESIPKYLLYHSFKLDC
jgi:hypothetical protein